MSEDASGSGAADREEDWAGTDDPRSGTDSADSPGGARPDDEASGNVGAASDSPGDASGSPHAVGHVHLKVRDLDRALGFYRGALGLDVTERHGRYAFLSWGERHHDVALQSVGEDATGPGPGVGLYHVAFEVATPGALAAVHRRLRERGVEVSPVDHGISKALYFDDPDGNGVEVYLDTRAENDEYRWEGTNERFDPAALTE